jgi:polysaccharide transporter, PST family
MQSSRTRRAAISRLMCHPVAQNSAALYGVQACRKIFPLISVPYLARTLNPAGWGTVAFVISLGDLVALMMEFGFNLSATREISRERDNREACRDIMAGVLGAQAILAVLGVSLALLAAPYIPLLQSNPHLVLAGLLYAVAQGMTPIWFFQGLERLGLAASLEVGAKALMLAALFVLVRSPQDAWRVVALQAAAAGVSTVAGIGLAFRSFSFRLPTRALVAGALRRGWPMFVFRSAESLYGVANSFVLGLFAAPAVVGYFASAEKISKAVFGLLSPVRDALYPRLSYLAASAEREAARLARTGIALMTAGGAVLALALATAAPWIIRVLAGPGFAPAVPVLRLMAALPLVLSVTYSAGLQWLLPLGRDRDVNRIILRGGALNLASAFLLAPRLGAMGMAISVVSAELFVAVSMVWVVWNSTSLLKGLLPRSAPVLPGMDSVQ